MKKHTSFGKMTFAYLLLTAGAAGVVLWSASGAGTAADDANSQAVTGKQNRAQKLPVTFEPGRQDPQTDEIVDTGPNVRWAVRIGSPTYAAPVVTHGKVLIGTLNNAEHDPRRGGDRSVLLCFDEKTGKFLWQLPLPKDSQLPYFDSFCVGISAAPTIVGDRAFLTTGRNEVLCLDINGMENGNTGPFRDEAQLYTLARDTQPPLSVADTDADIIWRYDMLKELSAQAHDTNNCDILYYDGLLIVCTANGTDSRHSHVIYPDAPSLIIMDAQRGVPLAKDDFQIGNNVVHGQWCSPGMAKVGGRNMTFYGGGNGVLYALEAPSREELLRRYRENGEQPVPLKALWTFHGDPRAQAVPKEDVPPLVIGFHSETYVCQQPPIFDDLQNAERIFMLFGYESWNGKKPSRSWLACIDAQTGKMRWGTGNILGGVIAPPSTDGDLIYVADRRGVLHAYDTKTGDEVWNQLLGGEIWAKPLVADGKIYLGTDRRRFYTLRAGRKPEILSEILMPARMFAPATAAGNTLYIPGEGFLYAVEGE